MDVLPLLAHAAGLPQPVPEHRFHKVRRWRLDWAWVRYRVAVEQEGGVWVRGRHTRGAGFIRDMAKYNAAILMGWAVLRYTPQQIERGEWIGAVEELLTQRGWEGR